MSDERQPDFDLDEDLFDFGGVVQESDASEPEEGLEEIFASFRDAAPAEDLLDVPAAPSAPREPRKVSPAPAPAPSPAPASAPTPAPAARSTRFAKGAVAIALSVTVLNSVLAVVMLRGRPQGHDVNAVTSAREEESGVPEPEEEAHELPDPESVVETHDHPTLDAAREEITHGEYAAARQRVYGLLAIIDRLEDPRRGTLEAECQFLIAQSLHLEALGRMGGPE